MTAPDPSLCGATTPARPDTWCVRPAGHPDDTHQDDTGATWEAHPMFGGPHRVVTEPLAPQDAPLPTDGQDRVPLDEVDPALITGLQALIDNYGTLGVQHTLDQIVEQM